MFVIRGCLSGTKFQHAPQIAHSLSSINLLQPVLLSNSFGRRGSRPFVIVFYNLALAFYMLYRVSRMIVIPMTAGYIHLQKQWRI